MTYPDGNYVKYGYDGLDRLTQVLENGSSTLAMYSYDLENHLTAASGTYNASLSYDPLGRLYQTTGAP